MDVFEIAPAGGRSLWGMLLPLALVLGVVALLVSSSLSGARNARFEVSGEGLRLVGDLYGRLIPTAALRAGEARLVDLTAERDLQPTLRTGGTGLPGYSSGWFRLRNGERALLYLTDRRRAVYVPTREGYSVLLSPKEPQAFLERLRRLAPGGANP